MKNKDNIIWIWQKPYTKNTIIKFIKKHLNNQVFKQLQFCLFIWFYFMLIVFLNACSSSQIFNAIGVQDEIDEKLPVIQTFRALPDVTSVGFEWKTPDDITNVEGYAIYRKNKDGKFVQIAFIKNALSTHYYDNNLKPQTSYEYVIVSVGKDSKISHKSDILHVRTSFIDPVEFIYASKNYAKQIKIFWSPSANPVVKRYIIEKKDEKSQKFIAIGSTQNRMSVEFFDNNLENGTDYSYRVIAESYNGTKSTPSKVVIGTTRQIPEIVQQVKASQDSPKSITIQWAKSSNPDIVGYNVWIAESQNTRYTKRIFINATSFNDKIDGDGITRYYKVTAVDKYNLESKMQENIISGQTLAPPLAPRITKGEISSQGVNLVWESNDKRAVEYIVYRQDLNTKQIKQVGNIKQTHFTDSTIQEGNTYTYYVVSLDKFGIRSNQSRNVTLLLAPEVKTNTQQQPNSATQTNQH